MYLILVVNSIKLVWNEFFNIIVLDLWYVFEDGGKYVYFFENFQVKDGKVFFYQLSVVGNLKFFLVLIVLVLKCIGDFKFDDLVLNDVVMMECVLVYLFIYMDNFVKKKMIIVVLFMYYNQVFYVIIVVENVIFFFKVEDQVSWYFVGEKGELLVFVVWVYVGGKVGWQVKQYLLKGELENEMILSVIGISFFGYNRIGFGICGSVVIDFLYVVENGMLVYYKDFFYFGGIEIIVVGI